MPARVVSFRDHPEFGIRHAPDGLIRYFKISGIDEIVGGIDPHDGHGHGFKLGPRIIVSRRFKLIDEIIRV